MIKLKLFDVRKVLTILSILAFTIACSNGQKEQTQTSKVTLDANLNPLSMQIEKEFSDLDPSTYNEYFTRTIRDSLLMTHKLELFFAHSPSYLTGANTWLLYVKVDGRSVADPLDNRNENAATFRLVFNEDGSLNTALSEEVLISNWIPLNELGENNGALGPINISQGANNSIESLSNSSNFIIAISSVTQRASQFSRTRVITPVVQLDNSLEITSAIFDEKNTTTYNQKHTLSVFDSLGVEHSLELYFQKISENRDWKMFATIDGVKIGDPELNLGVLPTHADFELKFFEHGNIDILSSEGGLISNWIPLDSNGNPLGADGPLNIVNGGILPIQSPPVSSNFEINFAEITLL